LFLCIGITLAQAPTPNAVEDVLPALETFVLQPIAVENISVWVPSDKIGPIINNSCRPKAGCMSSSALGSDVKHSKSEVCLDGIGRLLAEHVSGFHAKSVPLTIFNGWQWEFEYGMGQYESAVYDLQRRGGSWECSWEAVLTRTESVASGNWMKIPSDPESMQQRASEGSQSHIEIRSFSLIRVRDGYPKSREL
ncbi:hypothetical protein KAR91_01265, partial [Candidatus Pacearchaeota archaeon]|nr:hypothetical protein [Candidatus Pacearchaeota archaeon]